MDHARVAIQSLAHGGDGVARLPDGRTVFVPLTCPGDEVTIDVVESHDRWARGAVVSLDVSSPDRVEPPCPHFGTCGGCQWQHVRYETQLEAKRMALAEALRRIGKLGDVAVPAVTRSPAEYGYRNRIELSSALTASGPVFGFSARSTHDVVPIVECLLLPGRTRRLPKAIAGALRFAASRMPVDVPRVTVRVSSTGEIEIDLWTSPGPFPRAAIARVIAEATGAKTITRVIARGELDKRDIAKVEVLAGPGAWSESLGGDRYLVSAPSFFQANSAATALLREAAAELMELDGSMRAGDLYAGVGTFTLPLARAAGSVCAVEGSRFALTDLRRNLDRAGLDADIAPGDAAHQLRELGRLDAALIDPPRSGLSPNAIEALISASIPRIVYVSCDPATLSRDLGRLVAAGWNVRQVRAFDLFPQTYHLESIALLEQD